MSSLAHLVAEFQSLAAETKRKHPEVREAAEKSVSILKTTSEQSITNLAHDDSQAQEILKPVFLGCVTRNAKVVVISLGCLQRMVALHIVPQSSVPAIITTTNECMTQGVDIQLRILQTLLSLITNFPSIHGVVLGDAFLQCFRLHESRIAVVSSTAAATLRQLVMFVVDKVVEEDRREVQSEQMTMATLPDGSTLQLGSSANDAFSVIQDLCLLANTEKSNFLKLESLPKTFALELVESVLTNYHDLFRNHPELIALLQHHLCPLLLKVLSDRPVFPLTLRSTRVVFLLLKQFPTELKTESEIFLSLLIRVVGGDMDAAENTGSHGSRPHWMRVIAMEIIRGLCADPEVVRGIWERYDSENKTTKVFTSLITMLKRLITEKPAILGIGTQMFGIGVSSQSSDSVSTSATGYGFDVGAVAGMVATAASATVSGVVGMMGSESGLSITGSSMKVQCIDQLDKADSPPIPEAYIYLLALQCLVSLCDGFASLTVPLYNTLVVQRPKSTGDTGMRAPPAVDFSTLDPEQESTKQLCTVRDIIESGWPAFLASLSFIVATNLSDELFADVLQSYQNMANVSGILGLTTPRDAFLTSLAKFAIPSRVVFSVDSYIEPPTPRTALTENLGISSPSQPPGLSQRNLICLKVYVSSTLFLAGSLGDYWFNALEVLQNADYVLTGKGSKSISEKRSTPAVSGSSRSVSGTSQTNTSTLSRHPLLVDTDVESVQRAIQRLFDSSKNLEDSAFKDFVSALCRLSSEMVNMQSDTSSTLDDSIPQDNVESTPSSNSDLAHRRRVSGIHLPRTLRTGDFGVNKLGGIALQNLHRLTYRPPDVAWTTVTSHLLSILHNPFAPHSIRIQAAQRLDEIVAVVARNLSSNGELRVDVQHRVLDVLAQQVNPEHPMPKSSTAAEIRKMGLETLDHLLQSSGHSLLVGCESIFSMLGSVCESPEDISEKTPSASVSPRAKRKPAPLGYAHDKSNAALVRVAFHSLTLVCDSLPNLSPKHLRLCITTLGRFGRQMDTNIALTAAGSLMWGVSDSIQARRKVSEDEPEYSALWMFLLMEVLGLCTDFRPEVRVGAIQTLFRTLQLYGATLSLVTWDECLWKVVFPLLESLTFIIRDLPNQMSTMPILEDPSDAWNESKTLALQSVGFLFADFFASKIILLSSFQNVWDRFLHFIEEAFLLDHPNVSTSALRSLEKAVDASSNTDNEYKELVSFSLQKAWDACDEMGETVIRRTRKPIPPHLSSENTGFLAHDQETFSAFLDLINIIHSRSLSIEKSEWPIERLTRLIKILKGVITYPDSPAYRPDIDAPTPVQITAFTSLINIDLNVEGASTLVLRDLSEYLTLPFIAAFDVHGLSSDANRETFIKSTNKHVTYIGLAKKVMPKLVEQFDRFKKDVKIYEDETFEAILSAFSIPIKMKYECPPSSKFGSDPPLWKTATICFLRIIKEAAHQLDIFSNSLSDGRIESIWRQIIDVYSGAILADCSAARLLPQDEQDTEELFDLSVVASLEADIIPLLGDSRIPDHVVMHMAKVLHQGSRLYDTEFEENSSLISSNNESSPNSGNMREQDILIGTTESVQLLPRERFSYWCFDLLFLVCSDVAKDHESSRRRVAALSLTSLLNRCRAVLWRFVADEAVRGRYPFPRAREEELVYVLRKLLDLQVWHGSLWAALSGSPSAYYLSQPALDFQLPLTAVIADATRRSSKAHLFHFYNVFCQILSLPRNLSSAWVNAMQSEQLIQESGMSDVHSLVAISAKSGLTEEHDVRRLAYLCLLEIGKDIGVQ